MIRIRCIHSNLCSVVMTPYSKFDYFDSSCRIVTGFAKMLPLITASLVMGCAQELLGIDHEDSVVDSWVSYCHHCSVESVQRCVIYQEI